MAYKAKVKHVNAQNDVNNGTEYSNNFPGDWIDVKSSVQQNLFDLEAIKTKSTPKKGESYVFDIVDALNAPILTCSSQWAEMIPERILKIVTLARMIALMRGEQLATYAECSIYIYTRALDAPMDSEWTDIYTHVSCQTLEEWFGEDHWNDVKAPRDLNDWLLKKLNDLRRHIYYKRREMLKRQIRESEQISKKASQKENKEKDAVQTAFFS